MPDIFSKPVLVSTLGTNPQVVTLALDMLINQHQVFIEDVYVVHTNADIVQSALVTLREIFSSPVYAYTKTPAKLHLIPITSSIGVPINDITEPDHAEATFHTIYSLLTMFAL